MGLAACAGLRAWLPLLLLGGLARAGVVELGSSYQFLASNKALVLFGLATAIEVLGDKFPAVDHALDVLSTVLRPAAGSLLAASVLWTIEDPLTALVMGVAVGAPTSLVPHAAKATLRAASTAFTAGLANPVLSLIEDLLALLLFVLAVVIPVALALAVVAASVWTVLRLRRRRRTAIPSAVPAQ
ncbi:MAG TPA: DUF4126 domain-containing protein [Vicinamibacteria bacterium]